MSDYFNFNSGQASPKRRISKLGNLHSKINKKILFVAAISLAIPLTILLSQQEQDTRQFASTDKSGKSGEVPKPEYAKGEVIVKLVSNLDNSIKSNRKSQGVAFEKKSVAFSDLDSSQTPAALRSINQIFKIKKIGRVFNKSSVKSAALNTSSGRELSRVLPKPLEVESDIALIYKLSFEKENIDPYDVISELRKQREVVYAEPNFIYKTQAFSDTYYLDQYNYHEDDRDPDWDPQYDYMWDLKKIKAEAARESIGRITNVIKVAVIDTGVDYTHPDFGACSLEQVNSDICAAIAPGYNFVGDPDEESNNVMDDVGHGTHVAGTIAALSNDIGIPGMASGVRIMPIKGLGQYGGYLEDLAQGIYYAADNGAKVINASWGAGGNSITLDQAVSYAYSKGVVFVASAGNGNTDVDYFTPANITCAEEISPDTDCTITVSSTRYDDYKSNFSNYGTGIDVAAPGEDTISLKSSQISKQFTSDLFIGENYLRLSGTSMSAPHVAALAALVFAKNPSLAPRQVRNIILNGVDDTGDPHFDTLYGFGRINALKTVTDMNTNELPIAKISYPVHGMLIGKEFKLYGVSKAPNFSNYKVEIGEKSAPDGRTTRGIILENGGRTPVSNGLLATIDLSTYDLDSIKIILTTQTTGGKIGETQNVVRLDKAIKKGFPVEFQSADIAPPTIVDLNNDGKKEMAYQSGKDGKIYVLDTEGNNFPGWPKDTGIPGLGTGYWFSLDNLPIAFDLDPLYPGKELIFPIFDRDVGKTRLIGFHTDGTYVPKWTKQDWDGRAPIGMIGFIGGTITAGVIDGKNVIALAEDDPPRPVYLGTPQRAHLIDDKGNELPGWPVGLDNVSMERINYYRTPIIADLDADNDPEIIILSNGRLIRIFNKLGQLKKTITIATEGEYVGDFLVADMDSDGKKEMVLSTRSISESGSDTKLINKTHVLKSDGLEINHSWPSVITENITTDSGNAYFSNSLNVSDYNNDGKLEVLNYFKDKLYILNINANNLTNSPYSRSLLRYPDLSSNVTLNDGSHLVAVSGSSYYFDPITVMKYKDFAVSEATGFPKNFRTSYTWGSTSGPGALVDIDNDKKIDFTLPVSMNSGIGLLINKGFYIYSFNLNSEASFYDWPQYMHDEKHTNVYESKNAPTPTPTLSPTPTPSPTVVTRTLKLNPSADSYVKADQPSKNFGTATFIQSDSSPNTISYLKFNLSPLAGKTIVSAKLRIKVNSSSTVGHALRKADDKSWSESKLNYNNRPGFISIIKTFTPNTKNKFLEIDVKSVVNNKKRENLTLGITSSKNAVTRFYSRESSVANRPELVIIYK